MEETNKKVTLAVAISVIVALLGYAIKGFFGAAIGFVVTIIVVWLFNIWKKYAQ